MLNKILSGAKESAIGGQVRPGGDWVCSGSVVRQYRIENDADE